MATLILIASSVLAADAGAPARDHREFAEIAREAAAMLAVIKKKPKDPQARQGLAELALRAAPAAEDALSRGDDALFAGYRRQFAEYYAETRWRLGRMAEQGRGDAAFALGFLALHGVLIPRDLDAACAHFAAAVAKGYAAARFRHAQCIEERDPVRAGALLVEAADAGHGAALEWLGRICLEASPPDRDCAIRRLERAAAEGRPSAMALLGWMHAEGVGGAADLERAAALYSAAAQRGELSAINNLGELHEAGRGVPADAAAALAHYRRAAEAGFAPAQFNLGRLYAAGKGTAQDTQAARRWLTAAAGAGIAQAQRIIELLDDEARR